jgi:D-alanyl-D-alanine carboxypeptidase/D-alanyl-D-alanine-endopeptidase (penicillin-binding protein 4)
MRCCIGGAATALIGALALGPAAAVPLPGALASPAADEVTAAALGPVDARIASRLAQRIKDPRLGRDLTVRVTDPGRRTGVYASSAEEPQLPASTMKAVTAFVALRALGPTNRPVTRVVVDGANSRLTIIGGGDPQLTDARLSTLAWRTVEGLEQRAADGKAPRAIKVYFDDSLFAAHTDPPGWRSTYVPSEVNPVSPLQRFGTSTRTPARDAATVFARSLTNRGVVASVVTRAAAGGGAAVASVAGATVQESVQRMLFDSDNDMAELLARRAAIAMGESGTWDGWRAAASRQLRAFGVSQAGIRIIDGSGLSRFNRLTSSMQASLLGRIATSSDPALARYVDALPRAGLEGTLSSRFGRFSGPPASCAVGLVSAKTGTLSGVVALSGVATAADGRVRAFSFLVNEAPVGYTRLDVRRALDGLAATVTGCW